MKILLIIVTVILVATAAGSGYYIFNLNGQIHDLKTELVTSLDGLNTSLTQNINIVNQSVSQTSGNLEKQIAASSNNLTNALADTKSSLNAFTTSAGEQFTALKSVDATNSGKITDLANQVTDAENLVNSTVLKSSELYEKVKDSMVQITDGSSLYGSGFIVSVPVTSTTTYKYVVTAYHVVKNMPGIYITLNDGRSWKTLFYAGSEQSDVAFLGFNIPNDPQNPDSFANVPALKLADSSLVKPGDPVFVLGSPGDGEESRLGLKETLTTGVISQINRGATIGTQYIADLLQFDVAVNFGNSGSPLLNANGEVIGLVNARIDPTQGDGISFAVASNQVRNICLADPEDTTSTTAEDISHFTYQYPWSGLTLKDILPKDIANNGNTLTSGAQVTAITGPASIGGVKVGDVIIKLDNRDIHDTDEFFSYLLENYSVGDTVTLGIMRNGEVVYITVELTEKT